jgi:hypothetical protein
VAFLVIFEIMDESERIEDYSNSEAKSVREYFFRSKAARSMVKLNGFALVGLQSERVSKAEPHWYDAHGVGM